MGRTWDMPEEMRVKFPANTEKSLENIWQIAPGADDDTIYAESHRRRSSNRTTPARRGR